MNSAVSIYPSILTNSVELAQKQVDLVSQHRSLIESLPLRVPAIQLDIVDDSYEGDITIPISLVSEIAFGDIPCDVHLMTKDPLRDLLLVEKIREKHASAISRVIVQVEHISTFSTLFQVARELNLKIGLSFDVLTPISSVDPTVLAQADCVQMMGIHAGAQGRSFQREVISKFQETAIFRERIVDGGIKPDTMLFCLQRGITSFTVGSFFWTQPFDQAIRALASSIAQHEHQLSS
ncbi:MAG: hypothetical protein UX04_C0005G0044 [Microgenomates group bacterium GW2011_GWF2_45_18]|nr:MAG: hypothetical protein UW18_C0007G0045 [Microgenomates group bacterium GW2011_GWF1_44_10]KKU01625.1 MAG: hypothetical protein UX04_C0005G0044 [Microgenomates group bacterium GW2011_GWF2_45_18]